MSNTFGINSWLTRTNILTFPLPNVMPENCKIDGNRQVSGSLQVANAQEMVDGGGVVNE